jgi:hypothetical protein
LRQFDAFENPSTASRDFAPYVVVLQSHYPLKRRLGAVPELEEQIRRALDRHFTGF